MTTKEKILFAAVGAILMSLVYFALKNDFDKINKEIERRNNMYIILEEDEN